jgi:virginiamycin B lyase
MTWSIATASATSPPSPAQLVRIDPERNTACAALTAQPTTFAVPGHTDELLAGTESGAILRIRLPR